MNTLWFLILIAMGPIAIRGHFEFDNIRCLVRDQKFMAFDYCYLRSVNRTYKYMSVKTKMHQLPITNAMIILQVRLRENKRILYNFNVRFDACKFLRERSNVLVNWVFQTFADYSNFNHTCPYYHDIILDKVPIQHINKIVEKVVPDGRFYLNSSWFIDGIPRADLVIYFTKS